MGRYLYTHRALGDRDSHQAGLGGCLWRCSGLRRRSSDKPAGLRTLSLVTGGSALFTIISAFGFETADQSRVAAQIVTGVGFLGAGTVLRSGTSTSGLTAAATIWATAAIGMAVGSGLYIASIGGTALMLAILYLFAPARNTDD
ncbi:MAG: MgtC/SapB family protein [Chloroflexi bacterium]|nr:MAG: MgtC/SapB family protein [Chloroflexota bacterium]